MSSFQLSVPIHVYTGPLNFEFWRGEAPQLIHERLQQFTKPGKDGHGERRLGKWGIPITAELESHFSSYQVAIAALQVYCRVPGCGLVNLIYNDKAWADFSLGFTVQSVQFMSETHARILQIGPDYSYAGAGILRTRWQMTAISTGA